MRKGLVIGGVIAGAGCLFVMCAGGAAAVYFLNVRKPSPVSVRSPGTPGEPPVPIVSSTPTSTPYEAPPAPPIAPSGAGPGSLEIQSFQLLDASGKAREDGAYRKGERISFAYKLYGVTLDASGQWNILMHLTVTSPTGQSMLDQDLVDQLGSGTPIDLSGNVDLSEGSLSGTYTLHIVTRDKLAGSEIVETHTAQVQ